MTNDNDLNMTIALHNEQPEPILHNNCVLHTLFLENEAQTSEKKTKTVYIE